MSDTLEIRKTLIASTAHTLENDYMLLNDAGLVHDNIDYGTRIYVDYCPEDEDVVSHISKYNFSEGFKLLILFAVSHNCSWLELDSDGPIYERFPYYDW